MPRQFVVDPRFAAELRRLRTERDLSVRDLAGCAYVAKSTISDLENGRKSPTPVTAQALDQALHTGGTLAQMIVRVKPSDAEQAFTNSEDEEAALELARRVAASDVGSETLGQIEAVVNDLATAYPKSPPSELLDRVRRHLGYVARLFELRKTLDEHRRLIIAGGWLSLLAATLHTDLHQRPAAAMRLRVAQQLAEHAEHREIEAWCLETAAWDALTEGAYQRALDLSRAAQETAPRDSSAFIQATAQEGRACARLGDRDGTYHALERVHRLVAPLPMPERPEHHYQYDPAKAVAYTATTLSWVGDATAINYARHVITRLESNDDGPARPRRAASARLDLALALLGADEPDEAADATIRAISSGCLVPSNYWRVEEIVDRMATLDLPGTSEIHDAIRALRSQE